MACVRSARIRYLMSEANYWVLAPEEVVAINNTVPIGEFLLPIVTRAQFDKAVWGIVDWLFTHETDGNITHAGRTWSARLTQELEEGGFSRPDG